LTALSARTERRLLIGLLIAYVLLAGLYSIVTPIFEASDEQWHYPMVKYIADHGLTLPVQNPAYPGEWRQEGSQPPLYYLIGAVLTAGIDTSDLDSVRQVNPHADIGVIVPDGNVNMMVHDPARESFPWYGTVLAVHIVRFLSVLLGAITVAMTFFLARELFPDRVWIAFGAAALTAFNPMFLFISGSINNDNLSNALASALLVLLARLVKRTDPPPIRDLVLIGVVAGAGMLAKFNIGFLLPLIALALALIAWRKRNIRSLLVGGLITGGLTILIGGWWYVRNWQLYGDPTGLNVFLQIVGSRPIVADMRQLWSERHSFLMSYWGFFGGVNVPLPDFMYTAFNAIAALSVFGVGAWLVAALIPDKAGLVPTKDRHGIGTGPALSGKTGIALARFFTAIWIGLLFVSLLRWTSVTWASQGRLMFAAIAPIGVWMAVGLWQLGKMAGRVVPVLRGRLVTYGIIWFIVAAVLGLVIIRQAYFIPAFNGVPSPTVDAINDPNFIWATFCERQQFNGHSGLNINNCIGVIGLSNIPGQPNLSAQVERSQTPGQYVEIQALVDVRQGFLDDVLPVFHHNWSLFIHLVNEDGLIVAQRDVYPMQGQWASASLGVHLIPDTSPSGGLVMGWINQLAVQLPDYTVAPQTLQAWLGFYDISTGERLPMYTIGEGETYRDNQLLVGTVHVLPRPSALSVPNPMSANFADQVELVGYDVSSLVMHPDHKVTLTLYWRAKQKISTDYHVFVHVLDPSTTTIFGQDDSMPAAWTRPTSTWQPGEIIKDAHSFTIRPDAALGTWQIEAGLYQLDGAGNITRLRLYTPDGGDANDQVYLSRVLIKPDYVYF
jgi:4-amino-4-deoxy-L-arabinose transferase-like glycosyltransferase